jgi:hypothetical protein
MEKGPSMALNLICLASNIKKKVCGVLNSFLSFLKKFDERKHIIYMLALMLDPRFKSFHLVLSFIGRDQGVAIVEQYDTMSLYLMLMKCYYHLHPLIEFCSVVVFCFHYNLFHILCLKVEFCKVYS